MLRHEQKKFVDVRGTPDGATVNIFEASITILPEAGNRFEMAAYGFLMRYNSTQAGPLPLNRYTIRSQWLITNNYYQLNERILRAALSDKITKMKNIVLLMIALSSKAYGQSAKLDSVCKYCDSQAVRYCGKMGFKLAPIQKRKIRSDIRLLRAAEKFILSGDTAFIKKGSSVTNLALREGTSDSLLREELVMGKYFTIKIYIVYIKGVLSKGMTIDRSKTAFCEREGDMYYFDSRLIKNYILPNLQSFYVYNSCGQILVNTMCNIRDADGIKTATVITSNILNPTLGPLRK